MSYSKPRWTITLVTLIAICALPRNVMGQQIADVVEAWKATQRRVASLRIEWAVSETGREVILSDDSEPHVSFTAPTTHQGNYKVYLDGNRVRTSNSGAKWDGFDREYSVWPSLSIFDGHQNIQYDAHESLRSGMPGNSLGHVDDKRTYMDMANAFLLPVLLAFRPVEPALSRV